MSKNAALRISCFVLLGTLAPAGADAQTVLHRSRIGNDAEGLTYVDTGPFAGHAVIMDGYEVRGLPAAGKGHAQAPARTLFDLRQLVDPIPRGIAWIPSEKHFAIADIGDLHHLLITDHRGRLVERRPLQYPDPDFVPWHFEGLAYIPQGSSLYPDHLALVVFAEDYLETRIEILERSGEIVRELLPGGAESELWQYYGLGLTYLAPDRLLLQNHSLQEMNVLDLADGEVLAGPFTTAPYSFEGLVQMPDGRILASDYSAGTLFFFDQGLLRLPDLDRDVLIPPGVSQPVGIAWDSDDGRFMVTQTLPELEVVALPETLDAATPLADLVTDDWAISLPRGAAYLAGEELVAVSNRFYRIPNPTPPPGTLRLNGPIALFDKAGNLERLEVDALGLGEPREPEYIPATGQLALRFTDQPLQLQLLSRSGALEGTIDFTAALGEDSTALFAAYFDPAHPSGGRFLVYDWPDRRLVVTDFDGKPLGPSIDVVEALGVRSVADLAAITTGTYAGAFALISSQPSEVVIFTLDAAAGIVVPDGWAVEEVASGLNGPEGMALTGGGHLAVCEAQNGPSGAPQELRLTQVRKNGTTEPIASGTGCCWVDVERDPGRGYIVSQLSRGVQRISFDGSPEEYYPTSRAALGIAHDQDTGDIYVSLAWGPSGDRGKIVRLDEAGGEWDFRINTRADDLLMTGDRKLLAAVMQRDVGGVLYDNQIVAYDLETGAEQVLATGLGTDVGFLAIGRDGEIFVSDTQDGEVRRLVPDGAGGYTPEPFASGFTTSSLKYPGDASEPRAFSWKGLAVAPEGRLYVSDYGAGKIYVLYED